MATIKFHTSLEQSKMLAEFLSPESADMGWNVFVDGTTRILPINDWDLIKDGTCNVKFYPAWSLAALMDVLDREALFKTPKGWACQYYVEYKAITDNFHSNPVDACVAMIKKLHELKLELI